MDAKKLAIVLGIAVLLPLFIGLFVDAVYTEPKYEDYCRNDYYYSAPEKMALSSNNCTEFYTTPEAQNCSMNNGIAVPKYDANNCQVFDRCDFCQIEFQKVQSEYNRNVFFIIAPIGLLVVVLGIFLSVDYLGAGLMFAGLITMFYATVRYFSDMSKLLRALVILVELVIIMWIAYKKIGTGKPENHERMKQEAKPEHESKPEHEVEPGKKEIAKQSAKKRGRNVQ